jgi:hypothetical protein
MPEEVEKVLFQAQFDAQPLVDGTNTAITSITKLKTAQEDLNKSMVTNQQTFDETSATIAETAKQFDEARKQFKQLTDLAGRPIPVNLGGLDILKQLQQIRDSVENFKKTANFQGTARGFDELKAKLISSRQEIQQITSLVNIARTALEQMKAAAGGSLPLTEEVKQLNEVVKVGQQVLDQYAEVVGTTSDKTANYTTEIRNLENQLKELSEAGLTNTKTFDETLEKATELRTAYEQMTGKIRVLSSETKFLDFGVAAMRTGAAALEGYMGAMELFGVDSKTAEEAQADLMGIMALANSITELSELLNKKNALAIMGNVIAEKLFTGTMQEMIVVEGEAAIATEALGLTIQDALIATGIGIAIVLIGALVVGIKKWVESMDEAKKAQEELNFAVKAQNQILEDNIETLDFAGKIRTEKLKQQGATNEQIYTHEQEVRQQKLDEYYEAQRRLDDLILHSDAEDKTALVAQERELEKKIGAIRDEMSLNEAQFQTKQAEERQAAEKKRREEAEKAAAEALKLQQQIAYELLLRNKSDEEKELLALKKEFDERMVILRKGHQDTSNEEKLYQGERMDIVIKYANLRTQAEREADDNILKLSFDATAARIANAHESIKKEIDALALDITKQKEALQARQTGLLNAALRDKNNKILSPEAYARAVEDINSMFDQLFAEVDVSATGRTQKIFSDNIEGLLSSMEDATKLSVDTVSAAFEKQKAVLSNQREQNLISEKKYQQQLKLISDQETLAGLQTKLGALKQEQLQVEIGINDTRISSDERDKLLKKDQELGNEIINTTAKVGQAKTTLTKDGEDIANSWIGTLDVIIASYDKVTNAIMSFYDQLYQQQQAQLDRELAFQQIRVDRARILAERGNADALELEEKRQDELLRKKAAAAQKQLAIDNAIRLSQSLLAVVEAVASAATLPFPANIGAIAAAVAAVIGTIASAYSLINANQQPVQQFAEGTLDVSESGARSAYRSNGKDTIPAMLSKHEAVIPASKKSKYLDAITAIYNEAIPADVLNSFVRQYPSLSLPEVNYSGIESATAGSFSFTETNSKLDSINQNLVSLYERIDAFDNVNINVDEDGFVATILTQVKKRKYLNRS